MAKVVLEPIGATREQYQSDEVWSEQLEHMSRLNADLQGRRDEVRAGWGPKYEKRVRDKGKMPTWERLERPTFDRHSANVGYPSHLVP